VDGQRDDFQENCLRVCSAYSLSCVAGEPSYTYLSEGTIDTRDFIFHSAEVLVPLRLLSLPSIDDLEDLNPNAPLLTVDPAFSCSFSAGSSTDEHDVVTKLPHYRFNTHSSMILLPNHQYPSNHLPLMTEFGLLPEFASSDWPSIFTS